MAAYNNALIHNKTSLVVAMMREDEKYGVCNNEYKNVSYVTTSPWYLSEKKVK
jgi:hypothetical protein